MREYLGWITSCSNVHSCPQNWLECSVSEIPTTIRCHVCQNEVSLVSDSPSVERAEREGSLAAFPVVPPIRLGQGADALVQPRRGPVPQASPPKAREQVWVCTLEGGESVRITKPEVTIGRSRSCDVVIPSARVSRQHASLVLEGGTLWMQDLESANGVFKEGEKVTRVKVAHGDRFTISDETLLLELR